MFANRVGEAIILGDEAITTSGWTAAEPAHRMPGETDMAVCYVSERRFHKLFVRHQKNY